MTTNSVTEEEVMAALEERQLAEGIMRADNWLALGAALSVIAAVLAILIWTVKP